MGDFPEKDYAVRSDDAGQYVCNYSMYRVLNHIEKNGLDTKFTFIHIPPNYDVEKAREHLLEYLEGLKEEIE